MEHSVCSMPQLDALQDDRNVPNPEESDRLVYVGNYPSEFVEDDIRSVFKDFKFDFVSMQWKQNGRKAFCFLMLESKEEVKRLVEEMNTKLVDGRRLVVRASIPNLYWNPLGPDKQGQTSESETAEVLFDFQAYDYTKMPPLEPIPPFDDS